ncbi:MAG: FAD-dependent monooxygenase [Myxococcales bacterium]|nr:FAD-dependent monooxygenase [Myxococcales bacterium]
MGAGRGTRSGSHEVVIAGGGPTGFMLAAELRLAGVDVAVVERRATQDLDGSRAGGLHARTIEVLDQRGVAERFLEAGQVMQVQGFALIPLDISDFPARRNHGLALWQQAFERILAAWVIDELGVPVLRERVVEDFTQDDAGVTVTLAGGESLRAAYLVGCDGGRSVVRRRAGIEFAGWDASTSWLVAEVEMDEVPAFGVRRDALGTHAIGRRAPDEPIRLVVTEAQVGASEAPDLETLRAALVGVYGADFGLRSANWISRFSDRARQAVSYRRGRVLLAGDAAHVHSPHGGQGLNIGVQDAVNLGWKLAQVVRGVSPDTLLDSYEAERHPVAAQVLRLTRAQVALSMGDDRHEALRGLLSDLLGLDDARRHLAGIMSGLSVRYDLGDGHPLVGRRFPDVELEIEGGPRWASSLLHALRPVLLDLGGGGVFDLAPWADRVDRIRGRYAGPWTLPVVGEVPAPAAALIRPDGYVAWAGALDDSALPAALTRWFGPSASA